MPGTANPRPAFFVAGGTLSAEAGSYVEREADTRLYQALSDGKFCYVLNSRQMGKSSLCVRTMKRLEAAAVRPAFVDLTKIGGRNVTVEQWYAGIAVEIGRSLGLRHEILGYWKENSHVSPVQRLFGAIRDLLLEGSQASFAIFFDEIDATRSLSFSADEFFAAIRECFNRRVQDPAFNRLTFCLLGVAVPSDLINNPTSTPFNVGERIYVKDFTFEEALPLADGLRNEQLLQRVFYWTNGHPYLTQSLCSAIAADAVIQTPGDVDALVERDLFEPKARETNINLADVANRAIHAGDLEPNPEKFRADLLSAYEKVWSRRPLADDESNRVAALLKLSGLMRTEGNRLKIRNRIYEHVFNKAWIRENMPGQELRRKTRAYWLGAARTAAIGGVVIAIVSSLAVKLRLGALAFQRLADAAARAEQKAEYQAYVADVNFMRTADGDKNYIELARLLNETSDNPHRGIEWEYWNGQIHNARFETPFPPDNGSMNLAPDGKSVAVLDSSKRAGGIYSFPDLKRVRDIPTLRAVSDFGFLFDHWVSVDLVNLRSFNLTDPFSNQSVGAVSLNSGIMFDEFGAPDRSALALAVGIKIGKGGQHVLDMVSVWLPSPLHRAFDYAVPGGVFFGAVSSGGKVAVVALRPPNAGDFAPTSKLQEFAVVDMATKRELDRFSVYGSACSSVAISNDGRFAAAAFVRGRAIVRDVRMHKMAFDATPFSTKVSKPQISADDRRLLIEGDQTVQVYDLASRRLICTQPGGSQSALALDGKSFAVVGPGCRVYDVKPTPTTMRHLFDGTSYVGGVDRANRPIVVTGDSLRLIDPDTLEPVPGSDVPGHFVGNDHWRCVPEGDGFAVVSTIGNTRLCLLQGAHVPPIAMDATADGSHIVMSDASLGTLKAFDSGGRLTWTYHGGVLMGGVWSADGSIVVGAEWAGSLVVLDGKTGRVLRTIDCTGDTRAWVSVWSHDGHRLAWGGEHDVHLVDLDSKRPETRMTGHSGKINTIAFSPDDSRLLTAAADGTLRLWDTASGASLLRLGSGRGSVDSAAFDNGARRIYSTDDAGNLMVYRIGAAH